jgi:1-acyl-sn-glycerol-3-phosphate acyltransferase
MAEPAPTRSTRTEGPIEAARKALISGAAADLDARDPEFIRFQLPAMWLLATVTSFPIVGPLGKKWGIITADPNIAKAALGRGASVLVYPGGDVETHRPWTARNEIRFDGRKGFLRLAQEAGVPIVPVVAVGGQETFLPLTDGRRLAKTLRLDKLGRLKILPISLALPWVVNVGDMLGHIPLPAKIKMEILDPIDVSRFGPRADTDEAYQYVTGRMQEALTKLAAGRPLPPIL